MGQEMQSKKEEIKQDLIQKIGPWAFYSYDRRYWSEMSDRQIIEGAILHAPAQHKLRLLDLYDLNHIEKIWREYIVIQAGHHKAANIWAAIHLFKSADPEKLVQREFRKSARRRLQEGVNF